MGGGETPLSHEEEEDGESVESLLFDLYSQDSDDSTSNTNSTNTQSASREVVDEFKKLVSSNSSQSDILSVRRVRDFEEIVTSYDSLKLRVHGLEQAKSQILSYKPGAWIEEVGCLTMNDYNVPKTTTLMLVGLEGSGKSTLVNRILSVFEDDKFMSQRAQVSYNCAGDGTLFLHEYMIPRGSTSICVYDTRGLYENLYDNFEMIKSWMTKGVRHGELVFRDTDSLSGDFMNCKKRQSVCSTERRMVNFVIFVIDAISVLKNMDGEDDSYDDLLERCFNCPYLSCRDDKPIVICTHGDLLSHADRALVRVHLGELLGIPPAKQIFDIPADNSNPETDLVVVDMLKYSLLHADNNLPVKSRSPFKVLGVLLIALFCLCLFAFWSAHLTFKLKGLHANWLWSYNFKNNSERVFNVHATPSPKPWQGIHRNWNEIRHLW